MAYMSFESNLFPFITHPYSPDPRIFLKKLNLEEPHFALIQTLPQFFLT
jgi:hypothetical protein